MLETINVYADNHLSPALTRVALLVLDLSFVGFWFFCLIQMLRARAASVAANAAHDRNEPLREGARFVAGEVELAQNEPLAVRVTITQTGTEQHGSKGGVNHRWTETDRETEVRPFYIRHASGARIRVEPGAYEVLLVDALDEEHWTHRHARKRRATLSAGESAIVEGELVRGHDPEASGEGYRGSSAGWVLRPRDGVVHISTEDLGRRHSLRARAFAIALFVLPFFALAAQLPTITAHARMFAGHDEQAHYVQRANWTTRNNKGRTIYHYAVRYAPRDTGVTDTVEIDSDDYHGLPDGRGLTDDGPRTIWVRRVPAMPFATNIGAGVTVNAWLLVLSAMATAGVGYWVWKRHAYRRWYERALEEGGSGSLPTPSRRTFDER